MKIDRNNPLHWIFLLLSGFWALLASACRPFRRRGKEPKLVLLYGHKLSGNLLAMHRRLLQEPAKFEVAFLTLDPSYHKELLSKGEPSVLATSFRCVPRLVTADALISDHGLHALEPLLHLSDLQFFDVWHAIPFKGFDAGDFRAIRRYEEAWVASPLLRKLYVDLYGFDPDRVVVTGYARTDRLVREKELPREDFRARIGLPPDAGKVVMFAPTWKQDSSERSLFPFGIEAGNFCQALSDLATRAGATVILRTHLNTGPGALHAEQYERLISMPYAKYPDTEEILLATDVLVCDWSSIAFDFLLLDRPMIFLDVPAPFRKGFTLGPEYRPGEIVGDLPSLLRAIERALHEPVWFASTVGPKAREIKESVYSSFADGNAANRCLSRLVARIDLQRYGADG